MTDEPLNEGTERENWPFAWWWVLLIRILSATPEKEQKRTLQQNFLTMQNLLLGERKKLSFLPILRLDAEEHYIFSLWPSFFHISMYPRMRYKIQ